mgnify:CR=1 FL=1
MNSTESEKIRKKSKRIRQDPTIIREDRGESKKKSRRMRRNPKKSKIRKNMKESNQISRENPDEFERISEKRKDEKI